MYRVTTNRVINRRLTRKCNHLISKYQLVCIHSAILNIVRCIIQLKTIMSFHFDRSFLNYRFSSNFKLMHGTSSMSVCVGNVTAFLRYFQDDDAVTTCSLVVVASLHNKATEGNKFNWEILN